jgi:hypothetical protein
MECTTTKRRDGSGLPPLGEMLRFLGLATATDIEGSLKRQELDGGRLGTCLLDSGLVDEETLLAVLGAQLKVPTVDAAALAAIDPALVRQLPARAALQTGAVPLERRGKVLEVAMVDPTSLALLDDLWRVTRLDIAPRLALEVRVAEAHERLYGAPVAERLARTRRRIAQRLERREATDEEPVPAA